MKRYGPFLMIFAGFGWAFLTAAPRDVDGAKPSATDAAKADPGKRVPWKTSHITGSPEPPSPYRLERVFPKLEFKNPLVFVQAPGMDRFFVAEQAGPSIPSSPILWSPRLTCSSI